VTSRRGQVVLEHLLDVGVLGIGIVAPWRIRSLSMNSMAKLLRKPGVECERFVSPPRSSVILGEGARATLRHP
jgi:hypothetical protein